MTMPNNAQVDDAMWRGEVTAELRHIHLSLTQLHREIADLRSCLADELEDHRVYHARNETRWGPVRWCERHPLQFAMLLLGAVSFAEVYRTGIAWMQIAQTIGQLAK